MAKITLGADYSNPNLPSAHLIEGEFKNLVDDKGYSIYHDKMISCPCAGNDTKSAKSDCENCYGSGYVMVERVLTSAVVQGMNFSTKFKEWSAENLGTARITFQNELDVSYMDRIILNKVESIFQETKKVAGTKKYCFLTYSIVEVLKIFGFEAADKKLIPLDEGIHYTYQDNLITLSDSAIKESIKSLTVRYKHNPQYHIIDIPRSVMSSDTLENNYTSFKDNAKFPLMAVGRVSHFVLGTPQNYSSEFLDNTDSLDENQEENLIKNL